MQASRSHSTTAVDARRPAAAAGRSRRDDPLAFSDAQRYAWIRSHRDDFALLEALTCTDFGPEFDRRIDAAIRASQQRIRPSGVPLLDPPQAALGVAWWDAPAHPHRRRDDD